MRVQLRMTLDCAPDDAWDALHDPGVFAAASFPWLTFRPLAPAVLPDRWAHTVYPVQALLLGVLPVGEQEIRLSARRVGDARILEDSGGPTFGLLTLVRGWRHRMAVSPAPGGRTLFRDRLDVHAGIATPAVWFGLWLLWQWRASRIRSLARAFGED